MPQNDGWSREQLIIALKLYCEIPFGKMHSGNPEIIRFAKLIHRTPGSLAMKLTNFASLDPKIVSTGRKGLTKVSKADREIWNEMTSDWGHIASEIDKTVQKLGPTPTDQEVQEPPQTDIDYTGLNENHPHRGASWPEIFPSGRPKRLRLQMLHHGLGRQRATCGQPHRSMASRFKRSPQPRNGLCRSARHYRAFDQGLITISEDFHLLLSPRISKMKPNRYIDDAFLAYRR